MACSFSIGAMTLRRFCCQLSTAMCSKRSPPVCRDTPGRERSRAYRYALRPGKVNVRPEFDGDFVNATDGTVHAAKRLSSLQRDINNIGIDLYQTASAVVAVVKCTAADHIGAGTGQPAADIEGKLLSINL